MSFTGVDDLLGAWRLESAVEVFDDGGAATSSDPAPRAISATTPLASCQRHSGTQHGRRSRPVTLKAAPATTTKNGQALHLLRRAVQCRCRQRDRHPSPRRLAVPELAGHDQVRRVTIEAGRLSIIASDRTSADGRTFHSELIWLRV